MIVIALIVLLVLFAVGVLFVWWRYDMEPTDIATACVMPAIGIWIIYDYGGVLAWAGGAILLAIGALLLFLIMRRREPRTSRRGVDRDEA